MPASLDKKSVIQISACQNCYKKSNGTREMTKTHVMESLFRFWV